MISLLKKFHPATDPDHAVYLVMAGACLFTLGMAGLFAFAFAQLVGWWVSVSGTITVLAGCAYLGVVTSPDPNTQSLPDCTCCPRHRERLLR